MKGCLNNLISIKACNEKKPESGLYLDNLPMINLKNLADIAEGQTGKELALNSIEEASNEIVGDFIGELSKHSFQFKGIVSDESIKTAGDVDYVGLEDKFFKIRVIKGSTDKFKEIKAFDLGLNSDRKVKGKKFYIKDSKGFEFEHKQNLNEGYNLISICHESTADWIDIFFDLKNFRIGTIRNFSDGSCGIVNCDPCQYTGCGYIELYQSDNGTMWYDSELDFGFDLCISCGCSDDALVCYFRKELAPALRYLAGIKFLLFAKATGRITAFTNNKEDQIEDFLIIYESEYKQKIKSVVQRAALAIKNLGTDCFCCISSSIENQLP